MDAPGLDPAVYEKVLHDLARVNRAPSPRWPTLAFLNRAIGEAKSFRLMDVGFGDGDVLRAVARWARRRGIAAELVGVDLNEKSVKAARDATPPAWRSTTAPATTPTRPGRSTSSSPARSPTT